MNLVSLFDYIKVLLFLFCMTKFSEIHVTTLVSENKPSQVLTQEILMFIFLKLHVLELFQNMQKPVIIIVNFLSLPFWSAFQKYYCIVSGRVQNVTHFGTFVDIGVGTNGLIHTNRLGSIHPQFGDRVEVKILNVEIARKRIGLELVRLI